MFEMELIDFNVLSTLTVHVNFDEIHRNLVEKAETSPILLYSTADSVLFCSFQTTSLHTSVRVVDGLVDSQRESNSDNVV